MKKKTKKWNWPYAGRGELDCVHGVGHGPHLHGCDGCCNMVEFTEAYTKYVKTYRSKITGGRYATERTI